MSNAPFKGGTASRARERGRAQQLPPAPTALTLRKESSTPFPMYSVTIIMVLPARTDKEHCVSPARCSGSSNTAGGRNPGANLQRGQPTLPGC